MISLQLKNNTQCLPTSPSIIATMDNQIDENLPDKMIPDVEWEDLAVIIIKFLLLFVCKQ